MPKHKLFPTPLGSTMGTLVIFLPSNQHKRLGMSLLCFHFYLLCFSAIPKLQTHYAHELYTIMLMCAPVLKL